MPTIADTEYANCLLSMLQADQTRLATEPAHAAIVLWMVEELRNAATNLKLERETSKAMIDAAANARRAALKVRQDSKQLNKRRAA